MRIAWNRIFKGKKGESAAADFLCDCGMKVLERNFRCPLGEIDIIAQDGRTIVFVEVRGRRAEGALAPEYSITHSKRRRITLTAQWYLKKNGLQDRTARFDVVAVRWTGEEPEIDWIVNAFEAR